MAMKNPLDFDILTIEGTYAQENAMFIPPNLIF